jgi:Ca-activated chloride channel family protein
MNPASFGFERPWLVIAAFIAIPGAIAIARRLRNPFAAAVSLGAPGGTPFKPPFNPGGIVTMLRFFEYCGIFILFASVAGPVVKITETVWLNRGADIMVVLDVSPSMAALDMDGSSRYNVARKLLIEFANRRPSDGIGLVAVGNDAAMLVPPTTDREILSQRLENLQLGEMGDGTALGMGLAVAAYHLEKSTAPLKSAVLISDGENNAGAIHPETAAAMIREAGASLWVIGIGSGGEVPIDYIDPVTRMRRYGFFDSRYDVEALKRLSAIGDGTWIQAPTGDTLAAAFDRIDDRELVVRRASVISRSQPLYRPFLLTALGLILFARFVRRVFLGDRL